MNKSSTCDIPLTELYAPIFLFMQNGNTVLMLTAWAGKSDTAEILLEHGAWLEEQNKVMWGEDL